MINRSTILNILAFVITAALVQGCIGAKSNPAEIATSAAPAPAPAIVTSISDSDGDGVNDNLDECPNTRSGVQVDHRGCEIILQLNTPLFDFDKSQLRSDAKAILIEAIEVLKLNPAKNIEIAGHCDNYGSDAYNMKLGDRRAKAVSAFLIENGIAADKLTTISYGESKPIASNDTQEGRQLNRRVNLVEQPK